MKNIHKNEQIFGSHFLSFSIKIVFIKLCVMIVPNNSLELVLTLLAKPVAKERR